MDGQSLFERVRERADLGGGDAEELVRAVISALGEALTADEAAALSAQIPDEAAQWLRPAAELGRKTLDDVCASVAGRAGVSASRALELTEIVCDALMVDVRADVRERLSAHLGPDLGRLFELRGGEGRPERPLHAAAAPELGEGRTLATGRPGSRHPLSEARPDDAHSQSVARSDDPHADSKLSSAHGLTQETLHETLAEGRPGPSRTVADTKD